MDKSCFGHWLEYSIPSIDVFKCTQMNIECIKWMLMYKPPDVVEICLCCTVCMAVR